MSYDERVDVAVVGAGFAGLSAAKGYLQCAPSTNLIILDGNKSIGGTWASERLYQGLRSNNLRGTFEFPDYPFHDGFGVKEGEHLPGQVVHDYLQEYAEHWNIAHRIRFECKVLDAEKVETEKHNGWLLIVATGLTSQPQPMHVKGEEDYNAPMVNTSNLANKARVVVEDPDVKRVTIFGGSKSVYDAVWMFASAGEEVDWVIRKSGHGPTWMSVTHVVLGPLGKFWAESLTTRRFLTYMSPCLWGDLDGSGWWRYFLHSTWFGRKISDLFWWKLSSDVLEQSGYRNHDNLKPLIPDCSIFDIASSFAILNYPTDILDYVRSGQVHVYRQDLSHLSDHTVHLADGTKLASEAFVASTGWLFGPAIAFKDKSLHSDLGIPSIDYPDSQKAFWQDLDMRADAEIFRRFPKLETRPYPPKASEDLRENPLDEFDTSEPRKVYQPIRLYRSILPPRLAAKGDRSLAFAGLSANITGHIRNEIAGTWIYAYMNDRLTVDPQRDIKDVYWDAALFNRFCYRRYPYGFGRRFPDVFFDAVPFNDVLLQDLGINGRRKGGSWYRELFEPYMMKDYRGITAEWLAMQRVGREKKSC